MAVDDLIAALPDVLGQAVANAQNVVSRHNLSGNPKLTGLLCEGPVPEADKLGRDGFVQMAQKAQNVGFGPAGVAAADEMDDFHSAPSFEKRPWA
ncbi:hypothetical protein SDC9_93341 [bioreactor metagenome]|uniref:Uncharacterized protein n=1 Tax=bioreactor metagenome TaxID=1076179 RepID=A0A645A141_9ZZZZ